MILDVAQDLIQRRGANAMSYQHISEAVGIRKASIHHHFPKKENLIEELLKRYNGYFLRRVDDIVAEEIDAPTKLRRYIGMFDATLSEGAEDKTCPFAMLSAEVASLGSASTAHIRNFHQENEERLARILEQGRQEGTFRFEGDCKATAALTFSVLEGGTLIVRASGGVERFRDIAGQLIRMLEG